MAIAINLLEKIKTSPSGILLIGLGSIAALAASAKLQVPMLPVPITLQTAVVLLLPCLLGWRLALTILGGYFATGAAGIPVFAGTTAGPTYFFGPTGGYLIGFALATFVVGTLFDRKANWSFFSLAALMLAGHIVILSSGALWLAYGMPSIGISKAIATGIVPFLIGSIVKSAIVSATVKAIK
jgi:biotin transport system substrate-specific component